MVYVLVIALIAATLGYMLWKSRRRKTDGYVPKSQTQDYWSRFKATFSGGNGDEQSAEPNLFYFGQRLRSPSWKNCNGPLVWGTVKKVKKYGDITIHLDGTPEWLTAKRKRSLMTRINFPEKFAKQVAQQKEVVYDDNVEELLAMLGRPVQKTDQAELASEINELEDRLKLAAGYGAVSATSE